MSRRISNVAQESQSTDSLYDYFYLDTNRIKSLIAQLDNGRVLISLKSAKSSSDKISNTASAKIPFVSAGTTGEDSVSRSNERTYDPSFNHPIDLLSVLQERSLLKNSLSGCSLGDIVLINGKMSIFDAKMAIDAFPFLKKMMGTIFDSKKSDRETQNALKHSTDMLAMLPQTTQIDFLDTEGNSVWMSVDTSNLSISTGDIVLKYGANISGSWYMLGIVDAKPSDDPLADADSHALYGSEFKAGFAPMFEMIKQMAGRPNDNFGITPIIIFKAIQ